MTAETALELARKDLAQKRAAMRPDLLVLDKVEQETATTIMLKLYYQPTNETLYFTVRFA